MAFPLLFQSRGACPVPLSRALHDTPSAKLYSQPCLWHALQHQPPQAADNESIIRFSGAQLAQLHSEQRQSSELFINCHQSQYSPLVSSLVLSRPLHSVNCRTLSTRRTPRSPKAAAKCNAVCPVEGSRAPRSALSLGILTQCPKTSQDVPNSPHLQSVDTSMQVLNSHWRLALASRTAQGNNNPKTSHLSHRCLESPFPLCHA